MKNLFDELNALKFALNFANDPKERNELKEKLKYKQTLFDNTVKSIDDIDDTEEEPVREPVQAKDFKTRLNIGDLDIDKEEENKSSIDDLNVDDVNEEINNLICEFAKNLTNKVYESTPEKIVETGFTLQEIIDYISAYDDIRKFILSVKYNCDNKWILDQADNLLRIIK